MCYKGYKGLSGTGTKYLCRNGISCSRLSNSDSGRAGTGYLAGKNPENYKFSELISGSHFHFLNKNAQEKNLPPHFPDSCKRYACISGSPKTKTRYLVFAQILGFFPAQPLGIDNKCNQYNVKTQLSNDGATEEEEQCVSFGRHQPKETS